MQRLRVDSLIISPDTLKFVDPSVLQFVCWNKAAWDRLRAEIMALPKDHPIKKLEC